MKSDRIYRQNCLRCGEEFFATQIGYCSIYCEDKWEEQSSEKKKEKSKIELEKGLNMQQTKNLDLDNYEIKNLEEAKTLLSTEKNVENTTNQIEKTSSIDNQLTRNYDHLDSLPQSLKKDALESLNMLSDVNKELLTSMKRLVRNDADTVRLMNPDIGRAVSDCGKQLINSMRMKLDIYKFAKEIMDLNK